MIIPIYLYIPNLVGYFRLLLLLFATYNFHDFKIFISCYSISFVLDAVDGALARRFNQGWLWLLIFCYFFVIFDLF
jgi:CDP-diacylglycerol--inositol 3-phosphatidyltransferase